MKERGDLYVMYMTERPEEIREFSRSYDKLKETVNWYKGHSRDDLDHPIPDDSNIQVRKVEDHYEKGFKFCAYDIMREPKVFKCSENRKDIEEFAYRSEGKRLSAVSMKKVPSDEEFEYEEFHDEYHYEEKSDDDSAIDKMVDDYEQKEKDGEMSQSAYSNLNENIGRINQMIGLINENDTFHKPSKPEVPLEVRKESTRIISHFIQNPEIEDYVINGHDGSFVIYGEEVNQGAPEYSLVFNFDIDFTQQSTYRPGRYSGPPEDSYPDESEPAEYDLDITSVELLKGVTDSEGKYTDEVIFKGKDFTGIIDVLLSNEQSSLEFIKSVLDDSIQDAEQESQSDEDDGDEQYERYRDQQHED